MLSSAVIRRLLRNLFSLSLSLFFLLCYSIHFLTIDCILLLLLLLLLVLVARLFVLFLGPLRSCNILHLFPSSFTTNIAALCFFGLIPFWWIVFPSFSSSCYCCLLYARGYTRLSLRDCQQFTSPYPSCAVTVDVRIEKDRYDDRLVWMTAGWNSMWNICFTKR